jgi:hypothetical protein
MGLVLAVATIAGYGAIWWILAMRLTGHDWPLTYPVALLALALLLAAAWYRKTDESPERRRERARRGKTIGLVTGVQAVLIIIALNVLRALGHLDLLTPLIALIVGLHFLAFARLFPARIYYLTSALLVVLAIGGVFVRAGAARVLSVSLGASCILWLTCIAVLIWPESRRSAD